MVSKKTRDYVWKSPRRLANVISGVMATNAAVKIGYVALLLMVGDASAYVGGTQFTAVQSVRAILDLLQLILLIACLVNAFWIVRASRNAHLFKSNLTVSPIWAVLWYFVPVASLCKPFQAMSEIWDASSTIYRRGVNRLLAAWWSSFLIGGALGWLVSMARGQFGSVGIIILGQLAGAVGSVLFLIVVRRITVMQILKHTIEPLETRLGLPPPAAWNDFWVEGRRPTVIPRAPCRSHYC